MPKQNNNDLQKSIAKYSGIGFKMIVIISVFTYGGTFFDSYFATQDPWFTISFSLAGVGLGMYSAFKGLQ